VLRPVDQAVLVALEATLAAARQAGDDRPPFAILAASLEELGVAAAPARSSATLIVSARDDWLARLRSARRSESTVAAYRIAIDDLLGWLARSGPEAGALCEQTVVAYFDAYRRDAGPAEATYYRRFMLLRRFFRWLASRAGVADPFVELEPPVKPRQEADWLTREEFARLLAAAASPPRRRAGLARRDRLVLLALVTTGLRRSELIALAWGDVALDGAHPSLLVRRGKGGRPRRQPLALPLAAELARIRDARHPAAHAPVFVGLEGGRLQPTVLANIIRRAAQRAGIEKHVTAHTLRHTAATWLRQATGDARLVAEYLGHADLSTVHRYAHVAPAELHAAAQAVAAQGGLQGDLSASRQAGSVGGAVPSAAGEPQSEGRAPAPSGSIEIAETPVTLTATSR
jgi:site-specific recombinase XerD